MNLDEIKVVFMDFDDTICVRMDRNQKDDNYFKYMLERDWTFFNRNNRKVGRGIPEFILECKKRHIKLYGLTWGNSNLAYHAKLGWLDNTFNGAFEDVIFTRSSEYKLNILKMYSEITGIKRDQILFVDDTPDIVDDACDEGFIGAGPQQIAILYG